MGVRVRIAVVALMSLIAVSCDVAPMLTGTGAAGDGTADPTSAVRVRDEDWNGSPRFVGDCGMSAELSDGSVFWVFCDSKDLAPPVRFVNNVGAIAPPGDPGHPDIATPLTQLVNIPETWSGWGTCPTQNRFEWMNSVAVVPDGDVDRILLFFESFCYGGGLPVVMGVAELVYDHSSPPTSLVATVLEPELWDREIDPAYDETAPLHESMAAFGEAAAYDPVSGYLYVYRCFTSFPEGFADEGCQVARVDPDDVADPAAYEHGNRGTGTWAASPQAPGSSYMQMLERTDGFPAGHPGLTDQDPGFVFDVQWYDEMGVWGMTYMQDTPWRTDTMWFRISEDPDGDWSKPVAITVPECSPNKCRMAYGQPGLSTATDIAIGFYSDEAGFGGDAQIYTVTAEMFPDHFLDVPRDHQFFDDIEWLAEEEITTGYADHTFRPTHGLTRQAMAAWIYRWEGSPSYTDPATPPFLDVPASHDFYTEITWMHEEGLANGSWCGVPYAPEVMCFEPTTNVSRQALAAFLFRLSPAEDLTVPPGTQSFTDVPPTHTFFTEIEWLTHVGIADGYVDGTFRPGDPVSRQAAAAFLHRMDSAPTVSGTVTDVVTEDPIPGAVVEVRHGGVAIIATAGAGGAYDVGPVDPRPDYKILTTVEPWPYCRAEWHDRTQDEATATPIDTTTQSAVVDITFTNGPNCS